MKILFCDLDNFLNALEAQHAVVNLKRLKKIFLSRDFKCRNSELTQDFKVKFCDKKVRKQLTIRFLFGLS